LGRTLKGLTGGLGGKTGLYALRIPEATKKGYAEARIGDSINLSVLNSKTRRGRVGVGVAQTLDTGMQQHTLSADMRIRRLTPLECERLQGFPDNWTAGISDTQRYALIRLLSKTSRLHDPARGTGWAGACLNKPQLDKVAQGVRADCCNEKFDQLFEAESGLLTCNGKFTNDLCCRWSLHTATPRRAIC
jgi:hypothetical protein